MASFKLLLGLGMTVMLIKIATDRPGFFCRLGTSAQRVGLRRVGRTGDIARTGVIKVAAQKQPLRPRPDLDDTSSSSATTAPTSQ